jgi:DNA repair protein RadA/Sms
VESPVTSGKNRHSRAGPSTSAPPEVSTLGDGSDADGIPARTALRLGDTDRVLGGGLVAGSILLLGGAPGVGKSTLLLQAAGRARAAGATVLYVSGEESRQQTGLRAERLGEEPAGIRFLSTNRLEEILAAAAEEKPDLLCVDSIQTVLSEDVSSAPGTVTQVRECSAALQSFAKTTGAATVLVGHVTKGGSLAGPKTLEHLVDVVLHLEGQRSGEYRILRGSKNRFGSVDELAVFRMTAGGLEPVADPTSLFLEDRPESVSGSAVAVPLHGTRPLLAEIQALTTRSRYASPQRIATGFAPRRLNIILAVLGRRAGFDLGDSDVFLSVIGGLRLTDPAADLAVAAALASASLDRPLPAGMAFAAELGLGGELRGVTHAEARVGAAIRAGLKTVVMSKSLEASLGSHRNVRFADSVSDALRVLEVP